MTNRLKELRNNRKIKQEELAKIANVSAMTISRWEKGESQINPDKAQGLADYFGVSVGYLLGYENEGDPPVDAQLVLGKRMVEVFEDLESTKWISSSEFSVTVNGHKYKVIVRREP